MNVKTVVETITTACQVPPMEKTCDLLIAGDWDHEVTGIVTTFMATVAVIQDTIAKGANLIITHEPTYFTHWDQTGWLEGDQVYQLKKKLIEEHHLNIWRFHDHMHRKQPDMIYEGLHQELGWGPYQIPGVPHCYQIPVTTVAALADTLARKLQVKAVRLIGNQDARVERVGFLVGGGSLGLGSETMPMELMRDENLEVMVCGEIMEWTLCAYVRDASQLGLNKSMIVLGHNRTEEIGMKYLPAWLQSILPGIPVQFSEAGEPFI